MVAAGRQELALRQALQDLRAGRAQAFVLNIDQGAGIAADRIARHHLDRAVRPDDLPVRAAGQDFAGEPRAMHFAAHDVDDAAMAAGRLAQVLDRSHLRLDGEGEPQRRRR